MSEHPENSDFFRKVLGHCSTAVTVITAPGADDGDGPVGMTVGSFLSVSLDPPLVAFLPATSSSTWPRIRDAGKFCANVLTQDQMDLCTRFTRPVADRFAGVGYRMSDNGSPILDDCLAFVDCDIEAVHPAGDHVFVVGRVRQLALEKESEPLLFFQGRYRALLPLGEG